MATITATKLLLYLDNDELNHFACVMQHATCMFNCNGSWISVYAVINFNNIRCSYADGAKACPVTPYINFLGKSNVTGVTNVRNIAGLCRPSTCVKIS